MKYWIVLFSISLLGCGPKTEMDDSNANSNPSTGQTQSLSVGAGTETSTLSEADAIAALEKLGAVCTKDATGKVFAVACDQKEVTDADLANVKAFPDLKQLSLYGCPITDEGLEHLKGLTNMEVINLEYTKTSREGRDELKQLMPNCQIVP